jgi:L-alanine-DL-glutamate epimerase-like enolase superfamily enzyme
MDLRAVQIRLELLHTFRIARSADDSRESVLVSIRDEDRLGLGEAAPMARYGQTASGARQALIAIGDLLPDRSATLTPESIAEILAPVRAALGKEKAALAAVDIALHDMMGRESGRPLFEMLGLDPSATPVTSYTIGIDSPETIARKVGEAASFPVLKVKMGLDNDYEIMEQVRALTDKPVRIDANEGWTKEEALEKIRWLESQNVEFIEQPLPASKLEETRWLAGRISIPLFADESLQDIGDIPGLAGAFGGINIKLMKCGGIAEALRLIRAAREKGLLIMLGCTIESSIGITAAAQISPLVDHADLDGNILIGNDPAEGVGAADGKLILPAGPGIGVTLRDGLAKDALLNQ